jgi:predicted AlkP superfamily pyrophosphatase or phosphodiesterase
MLLIVSVLVWFRVYRPVRFDILEALIGHSHGYSNPVQHKLDAQKIWESGKEFVAAEASESVASPTESLAQYVPIWFAYNCWSMQQF